MGLLRIAGYKQQTTTLHIINHPRSKASEESKLDKCSNVSPCVAAKTALHPGAVNVCHASSPVRHVSFLSYFESHRIMQITVCDCIMVLTQNTLVLVF